jgi:hypothetical protein
MPASAHQASSTSSTDSDASLRILLDNVRTLAGEEMIQLDHSKGKNALFNELQERVNAVASTLNETDSQLARSLVSLLTHSHRLAQLQPDSLSLPTQSTEENADWESSNIYDTLDRQVSHLKARRADEEENSSDRNLLDENARERVERALLWNRIDEDLETVSRLCRQRIGAVDPFADVQDDNLRTIGRDRTISFSLPPEYDPADFEPPEYQYRTSYDYPPSFSEKEKDKRSLTLDDTASITNSIHQRSSTASTHDEKMRLDFEAITMAIDRLYLVAPQLHNQRVELRAKKREEMERAAKAKSSSSRAKSSTPRGQRSRSGSGVASGDERLSGSGSGTKGKGKMKEADDFDSMLSLIGKASSRRMNDQAVVLSDDLRERMMKARIVDDENVSHFYLSMVYWITDDLSSVRNSFINWPRIPMQDDYIIKMRSCLTLRSSKTL